MRFGKYTDDDLISENVRRLIDQRFYWKCDILIDTMRHNLLLDVTSMCMLIAILSLSTFYYYNQQVADALARSSTLGLDKFGIQVCCSWGNEITDE
jgi:hypothetical protein